MEIERQLMEMSKRIVDMELRLIQLERVAHPQAMISVDEVVEKMKQGFTGAC